MKYIFNHPKIQINNTSSFCNDFIMNSSIYLGMSKNNIIVEDIYEDEIFEITAFSAN